MKSRRIGTTVCLCCEGRMTLWKATNRSMSKTHEIDSKKWRESAQPIVRDMDEARTV